MLWFQKVQLKRKRTCDHRSLVVKSGHLIANLARDITHRVRHRLRLRQHAHNLIRRRRDTHLQKTKTTTTTTTTTTTREEERKKAKNEQPGIRLF
jgi:hypothetical protein